MKSGAGPGCTGLVKSHGWLSVIFALATVAHETHGRITQFKRLRYGRFFISSRGWLPYISYIRSINCESATMSSAPKLGRAVDLMTE
jgi:hypothetical protein